MEANTPLPSSVPQTEWTPITLPEDADYKDLAKASMEGVDDKGRTVEDLYPQQQVIKDLPRAAEHIETVKKQAEKAQQYVDYIARSTTVDGVENQLEWARTAQEDGRINVEGLARVEEAATRKIRELLGV